MKRFRCDCGSQVFFDNDHCLSCGARLGFDPAVLDPQDFSVLPLGLRLTADGAVVDRTPEDWPVGTVVTHIDGVSMDEIVARLVPRTFSDGVGEEPRRARISAEFSRNYHAEFGLRPSYAIRALAPDGTVIEAELQGLTPIALRERRPPSRIGSILGDSPEPWPRLHALPDVCAPQRGSAEGASKRPRWRIKETC